MPCKIFVSYRRDDDPNGAARIRDALKAKFGRSSVFMDVDDLLAGLRFDGELARALAACDEGAATACSRAASFGVSPIAARSWLSPHLLADDNEARSDADTRFELAGDLPLDVVDCGYRGEPYLDRPLRVILMRLRIARNRRVRRRPDTGQCSLQIAPRHR